MMTTVMVHVDDLGKEGGGGGRGWNKRGSWNELKRSWIYRWYYYYIDRRKRRGVGLPREGRRERGKRRVEGGEGWGVVVLIVAV